MVWIPQQLGRLRNVPVGIWTICLHFNRWKDEHLKQFRADLERFCPQIFAVNDVLQAGKGQTWAHAFAARLLDRTLRIGRPLREGLNLQAGKPGQKPSGAALRVNAVPSPPANSVYTQAFVPRSPQNGLRFERN